MRRGPTPENFTRLAAASLAAAAFVRHQPATGLALLAVVLFVTLISRRMTRRTPVRQSRPA